MPSFVKAILLGLVGLLCLGIGFLGTSTYFGARGAIEGFAYSCKILQVAESKGMLTKQQRATVAADVMRGNAADPIAVYMTSDCAKTPFQAITDMAKK